MKREEKIGERIKSKEYIKIDKKIPQENKNSDKIENIKIENKEDKENIKNENMKMYFYYPKYLQPEAVALIAQNLLNEWEEEEEKKKKNYYKF
jgi:hypothetical protein